MKLLILPTIILCIMFYAYQDECSYLWYLSGDMSMLMCVGIYERRRLYSSQFHVATLTQWGNHYFVMWGTVVQTPVVSSYLPHPKL